MTTYKWKPGAHVGVDAQVAGEELTRIREAHNGRLLNEDVVTDSMHPSSALHGHFEWDNAVAGHKYRLGQAGDLIRWITVETVKPDGEPAAVRAFVNVTVEDDRHYTTLAHALGSEELRAQVLAQALRDLKAWQEKYRDLVELAEIFSTIRAQMDMFKN